MNKLRQEVTKYVESNLNRIAPVALNEDEKATVINKTICALKEKGHNANCARSTLYKYVKESVHSILDLRRKLSSI